MDMNLGLPSMLFILGIALLIIKAIKKSDKE